MRCRSARSIRIFLGDLESVRHPGQQGVEGLAVKMIEAGTFTHTVDRFLPLVHRSEEVFAVGQSACFQSYLEILLESTLSARGKRFVGCSERSGRIELAEFHNGRHGAVIDGARIENDAFVEFPFADDLFPRRERNGIRCGPGRMFRVDQRSGVMASALGRERAHDGELVVQLSEFFKGRTKGYSGSRVGISPVMLRISAGASIFGSKVSNWLGPPCMKRKITARSLTNLGFGKGGCGLRANRDASPAQSAKTQEVSSPDPLATQIQHGMI